VSRSQAAVAMKRSSTAKRVRKGATSPAISSIIGTSEATANARAYAKLRQAVLSGEFRPGDVVTLRALTETLSLGDMAAREALKRLISEGAFEALPNRSARIPVLDRREIQQLCELRILLETKAAFLAAGNITLNQINDLQKINNDMKSCIAQRQILNYKQFNMAFHFSIYRIADNRPLASLIESLWLRMAPFISRMVSWSTTVPGRFEKIAPGHHDDLLQALHDRDAAAAHDFMKLDLAEIHGMEDFWATVER
jgi:DNA-binding GntR family transcriptional regulator